MASTVTCPSCREENEPERLYCKFCGHWFSKARDPEPPRALKLEERSDTYSALSVQGFLRLLGVMLFAIGIIGGVVVLVSFDWDSYRIAKKVADELVLNEYAEARLQQYQNLLVAHAALAGGLALSGIISGTLFLFGAALMDSIKEQTSEIRQFRQKLLFYLENTGQRNNQQVS